MLDFQGHYVLTSARALTEPEGAGEYGQHAPRDEEAKPALSDRLRDAAATVGDKASLPARTAPVWGPAYRALLISACGLSLKVLDNRWKV